MSEPTDKPSPTPSPAVTPPAPSPTPAPTPTPEPPKPGEPPKPVEPPKEPAKAVEPLTLETLKFPENTIKGDDPARGEFLTILNNDKLDPAGRAQALLDLYGKVLTEASEKGSQAWDEQQAKWEADAKADPVIGGKNLAPALGNIAKLIDSYALDKDGKPDPKMASDVREALDTTGAGNHPALIRWMSSVAKVLVKEGDPVPPNAPGNSERTAAQILYPTMNV